MRHDNDGRLLFDRDPSQKIHDDARTAGVEWCGRLVGEDDARPVGKRAGDSHALRFAARQLRRHCMFTVGDIKVIEKFEGARARRRAAEPSQIKHNLDVVAAVKKR